MNLETVTLVNLPPLRVAAAHAFGVEPESTAMERLLGWAGEQNLWPAARPRRFSGFNSPNPSPDSPEYGYEFWMALHESDNPVFTDEVRLKHFPGGQFAVVRCHGVENLRSSWQGLVNWAETNHRPLADNLLLEEFIIWENVSPDRFVFDLYLPLKG